MQAKAGLLAKAGMLAKAGKPATEGISTAWRSALAGTQEAGT
jgi:hypothetical protein